MKNEPKHWIELPAWLKPGALVDYHSTIGGPVTSTDHTVESVEQQPSYAGRPGAWVVFISGKRGWVAAEALSPMCECGTGMPCAIHTHSISRPRPR